MEEKRLNWLKVGYGIHLISSGIRPYIDKEAKAFHNSLIAEGEAKGWKACTCQKPKGHDMAVCDWAKELKSYHSKRNPTWNQSDGSKWTDPNIGYWEVAKLFMPFGCASGKISAEETDATGLLNLLRNCDYFRINKPLVANLRSFRNIWAHAAKPELSQGEKDDAFMTMKDLLQDPELLADSNAKETAIEVSNLDKSMVEIIINQNTLDKIYSEVAFSELCEQDSSIVQDLALLLDRKSHVVSYFAHLAEKLKAPPEVKATCESNREYSCTLELLDIPTVAARTVKDLIENLKNIHRNDIVGKLSRGIPEKDREKTIKEVLLPVESDNDQNQPLLTYLTNQLDKIPRGRAVKYWYDLGLKLGINRNKLDLIKRGSNPTERLLVDYAYKEFESDKLTVGWFRQQMAKEHLDRCDVLSLLTEQLKITDGGQTNITALDERSMKEVFQPNSDELEKLCVLLNKDTAGTKCWKHLACAWGIEHDVYSSFEPSTKTSPTEILLEWLNTYHPNITVGKVCDLLESIKRRDARAKLKKMLKKYLEENQLPAGL